MAQSAEEQAKYLQEALAIAREIFEVVQRYAQQ